MSSALHTFEKSSRGFLIFTSSQNWVVPSGVHKIKAIAIGAGGGGGGGYSSTYNGGGGGAGAIVYGEMMVAPGQVLQILVGAGGAGGTGGSSPTNGGNGGGSGINDANGETLIGVFGGSGGRAATSSANGAGGGGGAINPQIGSSQLMWVYDISGYNGYGNGAPGSTPTLIPPGIATTTPVAYYTNVGQGGQGGGVNKNGSPGKNGIVIIWWGD
jgi:hypothetical protein